MIGQLKMNERLYDMTLNEVVLHVNVSPITKI
jgi:hypothetical protein